jgi:hypothetical protein
MPHIVSRTGQVSDAHDKDAATDPKPLRKYTVPVPTDARSESGAKERNYANQETNHRKIMEPI